MWRRDLSLCFLSQRTYNPCKSMKSPHQRRVVDNKVISDALPALEIKVDPAFVFVGILSFVLKEIALVERFIFVDGQASETTRLFIVQFEGILDGVDFTYNYRTRNPIILGKQSYHQGVWIYSNAESVMKTSWRCHALPVSSMMPVAMRSSSSIRKPWAHSGLLLKHTPNSHQKNNKISKMHLLKGRFKIFK
jgi:hypothetical protein